MSHADWYVAECCVDDADCVALGRIGIGIFNILVANDRFGLYSLYYATRGGRLLFAPEVKGILFMR